MDQTLIDRAYKRWVHQGIADADLQVELAAMFHDFGKCNDAFYRHLSFGTGCIFQSTSATCT